MEAFGAMSSFEGSAMGKMAIEKSKELFGVCDTEDKGFIIKRDMQRLQEELPGLTPDQLEEVFESLDQDHNGFLTMDEFVKGFGAFLGLQVPEDEPGNLAEEMENADEDEVLEESIVEQDHFDDLMDRIGAAEVFSNQEAVQDLWTKLRQDEPELLTNFERFLSSVSNDMKRSKDEFRHLESAMENKNRGHDSDVQKLYEEMENQIKAEREKILHDEREKARREREEMERDIEEKDQQLQEILRKQSEMERKVLELNDIKAQTDAENEQLQKEREQFERQRVQMQEEMEVSKRSLDDARDQLDGVKKQTRDERRKRAQASFKGIACEREDLVQQLDHLRHVNKKLKDERDELRTLPTPAIPPPLPPPKKGSLIGPYLRGDEPDHDLAPRPDTLGPIPIQEEYECDEDFIPGSVEVAPTLTQAPNFLHQASLMDELVGVGTPVSEFAPTPTQTRVDPLGGNEAEDSDYPRTDDQTTPDRIFKVVFVGDSGVGKTCFLHRFCHNRFKPTFSATIGVDFTVKSIRVGDRVVALQLWDTAGQERFRSITKQYFRKADGVVLMYDVTSEQSFINLRNWVQSVREGVDDACVLCLVGNKLDLCDSDESRVLKYKDGEKLADEFRTLFFETSAQTGHGIKECMKAMAIHLQEREDKHLEDALKLDDTVPRRKKCCGKG